LFPAGLKSFFQFAATAKNVAGTGNDHNIDIVVLIYPAADIVHFLPHLKINSIIRTGTVEGNFGDVIVFL
jgi:hypothetical protein